MNPDTPAPVPPGDFDSSQFDFIMNSGQNQKKSLIPGSGKQRTIIFMAGVLALVTILIVIIMGIVSGGGEQTDSVVTVARQQNEIIRIAAVGNQKADSPEAKTLAAITTSVITSDQKQTVDYLATQGRKLGSKELALGADKSLDSELDTAESNGRFDDVFIETMNDLLAQYQTSLRTAHGQAGSKGKEVLQKSYNNANLILKDSES